MSCRSFVIMVRSGGRFWAALRRALPGPAGNESGVGFRAEHAAVLDDLLLHRFRCVY
jgi:hypothetical protein